MNPSLRARLTMAVVAAVAVALTLLSWALYALVSRAIWAQRDHELVGRAQAMAALVEHDEDGWDFEPPESTSASGRSFYFEMWSSADGKLVARSASLGVQQLPMAAGSFAAPHFADLVLADGQPARLVAVRFLAREESPGQPPAQATLAVAEDVSDLLALLADLRRRFFGLGLGTLAAVASLAAWILARGLRPLGRLGDAIARIDERSLSSRLSLDGQPAELVAPVRKLNQLLARLGDSFARERRFTADVSHELRTPLAGLRTLLEVTLLKPRPQDEYQAALVQGRAIAVQLGTVVENLLVLARLDAGQVEIESAEVPIMQLVEECWRPHATRAAERGLRFRNEVPASTRLRSDRGKLQLVLCNLLANASEYTEAGGWIAVRAGSGAPDDPMIVAVVDSGPHLPEEQLDKVFDRFWRADAARGGEGTHCGIGLSLARSMCACLGLEVSVDNQEDGSLRFSVRRAKSTSHSSGIHAATP